MAGRKRTTTVRAKPGGAKDPGGAVPEVQDGAGEPVPAADAVGRVSPRAADARRDPAERPAERPAPPVDVTQLDQLLDGLFSWPVELQDMYDVAAAITEMWPGCAVEAKHVHHVEVHITVGWGDWHHGARVYRVVRQPGVESPRPKILPAH